MCPSTVDLEGYRGVQNLTLINTINPHGREVVGETHNTSTCLGEAWLCSAVRP